MTPMNRRRREGGFAINFVNVLVKKKYPLGRKEMVGLPGKSVDDRSLEVELNNCTCRAGRIIGIRVRGILDITRSRKGYMEAAGWMEEGGKKRCLAASVSSKRDICLHPRHI